MAEKSIEARHRKAVKARGGIAYKFTSPGRRGVPDRLVLFSVDRAADMLQDLVNERVEMGEGIDCRSARFEAERIVARVVRFAEFKDFGKKAKKHQKREHKRLRAMGFRVDVPASYEAAEAAAQ